MRKSGILLPVSSLPSKYGIGCFSKEAYKFIDRLKEAGQAYWQILPLGPTSYGDSPYQSFSTFAGNPYFIDPEDLVARGYVTAEQFCRFVSTSRASYIFVLLNRILPHRCKADYDISDHNPDRSPLQIHREY